MTPIQWMNSHAPGFAQLPDRDRDAIMHFALLWSLFEAKALDARASVTKLRGLPTRWIASGAFEPLHFAEALNHFKARYFRNGKPTAYFRGLRLSEADEKHVLPLGSEKATDQQQIVALLVILYRLRNNLFHGEKWANQLADQHDNFRFANQALMKALEAQGAR